jgi:branched-chain amino acid transport system permease protein
VEYTIDIVNQIFILLIFVASLNVLMGYAGQASVAHAALGGIGGYTAGYLSAHHGWPFWATLLTGAAAATIFGTLVALPALRFAWDYLVLLTLAVATIFTDVVSSAPQFGGAYGILGVHPLARGDDLLVSPSSMLPFTAGLALIVFFICWRMGESPFGRVLRAIRGDESVPTSLGKNTVGFKVLTFGLTAGMAGVGGVLLVYYDQLVTPDQFSFDQAVLFVTMLVFGGSASLIGTAVIFASGPILQQVNVGASQASLLQLIIYGAALVLLMRFRPQGLLRERRQFWKAETPAAATAGAGEPSAAGPRRARIRLPRGTRVTAVAAGGAGAAAVLPFAPELAAARAPASEAEPAADSQPPAPAPAGAPPAAAVTAGGPGPAAGRGAVTSAARQQPGRQQHERQTELVGTGLRKRFGGIAAVDGVDITLRSRELLGLIGPNGAGKSTLFALLTGFAQPDAGSLHLNGTSLLGMPAYRRSRLGVARSFQDIRLIPDLTVLDNVTLAAPANPGERLRALFAAPRAARRGERAARAEAQDWLSFVGLGRQSQRLAGELGHGEQKLVALARVLATGAELLLLDEPTSGVEHTWIDRLAQVIVELPGLGRGVCIVEHNLSFLRMLSCPCVFMEAGRIAGRGSLEELMQVEDMQKAYFGL